MRSYPIILNKRWQRETSDIFKQGSIESNEKSKTPQRQSKVFIWNLFR